MSEAILDFSERRADQHDKLARTCCDDKPGTAIERWRSLCLAALFAYLLGSGRDVTIVVGRRTDRKSGDFAVVLAEERN